MVSQKKAYVYAIIVVLIWSTIASAFKLSLRYVDFFQLLFFASITSTIILFIIIVAQNKIYMLSAFSKRDISRSVFLGFLNPFLYYIVLLKAYSLLSAQRAVALNYTWPIMIVVLSIPLLKQKIRLKGIIAIFISYIGALVISTEGDVLELGFTNLPGVVLALGSAFIWALFWIYNVRDKRDEVVKLFLNFVFGFIFIFITGLVTSNIVLPDIRGLVGAVYVGIFEMGITFVLWLKALKLSKTTAQVSNLIYIAPFLALFIINIIVGEKILLSTIIGLILIITGIIIQQYTTITSIRSKPV
ncbi:MAG: DMT family transporter [candidate division WOR-3 bacterium]|nr:MAG: DMT family transporter [candidate division WOR-3 bacterium]